MNGTLKTGIVHLGLGAFHRAHQADYTQDADVENWGIEAVSMRDPSLANAVTQNPIFTLVVKQPSGNAFKPISAIKRAYCLAEDPHAVAQLIAAPNIHVVTITVTEKGYSLNRSTGGLDEDDPIIRHDLQYPDKPKGLLGIITAGLSLRMTAGGTGLTLISCDNLASNGKLLKRLVLEFAGRKSKELANWIEQNCTFPSSMVDRITPATSAETLKLVEEKLGYQDPLAVETEPFRQWVIEDNFAGPRPAWEKAGVSFVTDVEPFELMKLRMLNGAHSLIAYLGTFLELEFVRSVMAEKALVNLIDQHMGAASETVPDIGNFNLSEYKAALKERFENTAIDHQCNQIAMDGSQKMPQRIFAPAKARLQAGKSARQFALATALWMKHIEGKSVFGNEIELNDPLAGELRNTVNKWSGNAAAQVAALGSIGALETHGLFEIPYWVETVSSAKQMLDDYVLDQNNASDHPIDIIMENIANWLAKSAA